MRRRVLSCPDEGKDVVPPPISIWKRLAFRRGASLIDLGGVEVQGVAAWAVVKATSVE